MKFIKYEECKIGKYAALIKDIPPGGSMIVEISEDELETVKSDFFSAAKSVGLSIKIEKATCGITYKISISGTPENDGLKKKIIHYLSKAELSHGVLINRLRPAKKDDAEKTINELLQIGVIHRHEIQRGSYKYSTTAQ